MSVVAAIINLYIKAHDKKRGGDMLARENRIVSAEDFRHTLRKGKKAGTGNFLVHVARTEDEVTRVGFLVTKVVGKAHDRNLVRRRAQVVSQEKVNKFPKGFNIVIRALPGAEALSWDEVHAQLDSGIERAIRK